MAWGNVSRPKIHLEDLSFEAGRMVGLILDSTQDWRILAAELGYGLFEIEEFARAPMSWQSSTQLVLQKWRRNKYPTLEEVCAMFIRLDFGGAVDVITAELSPDARQRVQYLRTTASCQPSYSTSGTMETVGFMEGELPLPSAVE